MPPHERSLPLPVLSALVNIAREKTVVYHSLVPGCASLVQVMNAIAKHWNWKSVSYVGDEGWDLEVLNGLADADSSLEVRMIIDLVNIPNAKEVAIQLLSSAVDVVVVHCQRATCSNIVKKIFQLVSAKSELPWLITDSLNGKILMSDLQVLISNKPNLNSAVFGIQRALPRSKASAALLNATFSQTAAMSKVGFEYLYDGILVLAHLQDLAKQRQLSLVQFVDELSIHGDSGMIQFRGSQAGSIGDLCDIVYISPTTFSLLTVGTYDIASSHWLYEITLPTSSHLHLRKKHRRSTIADKCLPASGNPRHFWVTTLEEPPFVIKDENNTTSEDKNGIFYGFVVDMMNLLDTPERLNFTYTMREPPDGLYGTVDEEKRNATGMLGRLLDCSDNLAVGALTITADHQKHVSFTKPFLDTGLALLAARQTVEEVGLWIFLKPFHRLMWISVMASCLVCAVCLVALHRLSPYGTQTTEPDDELPFTFKLHNSMWFLYTSFVQQGEDVAFLSGKVLLSGWFFFCLIAVATYTANLAAFITVQTS